MLARREADRAGRESLSRRLNERSRRKGTRLKGNEETLGENSWIGSIVSCSPLLSSDWLRRAGGVEEEGRAHAKDECAAPFAVANLLVESARESAS